MKIALIPFEERFITPDYIGWLNDPVLLEFSMQSTKRHSLESCKDYLSSFKNSPNFFWSIQNEDSELLGTMTAYLNVESNIADIGILVGKPGLGIGSIAWGEALKYLFETIHVRKVTAGTLAPHLSMIKIFQKWGMQQEALLRRQVVLNAKEFDIVKYGILSPEWSSRILVNNHIS